MSLIPFSDSLTVQYLKEAVTVEVLQETAPSNFSPTGTRSGVAPVARRLLGNRMVNLPPEATGYLASTVANPEALAAQVDPKSGYLSSYSTAEGTLFSVRSDVYLGTALPLFNPRVGDQSLLRRPSPGSLFEGSSITAVQNYSMTLAEFQDHLRDTVARVATVGGQYAESILATGVSEPGLCEVASIHLTDINVRFTTLVLRDGGTRCVQSVLARLGVSKAHSARAADFLLERLFGTKLPSPEMTAALEPDEDGVFDITQIVKRNLGRAVHSDEIALEIATAGGNVQEQVSIQQTMVLPQEILIGWQPNASGGATLEPAISARVRSRHVNIMPWAKAAQNADVIDSVITQLVTEGFIDEKLEDLLDADSDNTCARALGPFGYTGSSESAPLWRAAVILQQFTSPALLREAKRVIRSLTGKGQVRRPHLAGYLATLIDAPWRSTKRDNASQSGNAWARSGALTQEMIDTRWSVKFVSSPEELLSTPGNDARITLAALGGVALIADRFLTSVAIAGTASGGSVTTPYRVGQISELVEMLSAPDNVFGQQQLAAAAAAFRHDGLCSTPWAPKELAQHAAKAIAARSKGTSTPDWYNLENVVSGSPLTISGLMEIADYDGARSQSPVQPEVPLNAPPVSAEGEALTLNSDLRVAIDTTETAIRNIEAFSLRLTGHYVLSLEEAERVTDTISSWLGSVVALKKELKELEALDSLDEDQGFEVDFSVLDD